MAPEIPDEVLVDDGILGIQRLCEQGASSCRSVAGLKLHWEDRERLRCPGLPRALCHCQLTTRPARSASMRFVVKPTRYRVDGCGVLGDDGGDGACVRAGSLTRSRIGSSTNVA